jgi:hypothetical protein
MLLAALSLAAAFHFKQAHCDAKRWAFSLPDGCGVYGGFRGAQTKKAVAEATAF